MMIKGYYDGKVFRPMDPVVELPVNTRVLITAIEQLATTERTPEAGEGSAAYLRGCIPYSGPAKSIEEMEQDVIEGFRGNKP